MSLNSLNSNQEPNKVATNEINLLDLERNTEANLDSIDSMINNADIAMRTLQLNIPNRNETEPRTQTSRVERLTTVNVLNNLNVVIQDGETFFESSIDNARVNILDAFGNEVVPSPNGNNRYLVKYGDEFRLVELFAPSDTGVVAVPTGFYLENRGNQYTLRPNGYTPEEQNFDFT